jgi:hypothetical protein
MISGQLSTTCGIVSIASRSFPLDRFWPIAQLLWDETNGRTRSGEIRQIQKTLPSNEIALAAVASLHTPSGMAGGIPDRVKRRD